jgi:hypothetical protein
MDIRERDPWAKKRNLNIEAECTASISKAPKQMEFRIFGHTQYQCPISVTNANIQTGYIDFAKKAAQFSPVSAAIR